MHIHIYIICIYIVYEFCTYVCIYIMYERAEGLTISGKRLVRVLLSRVFGSRRIWLKALLACSGRS